MEKILSSLTVQDLALILADDPSSVQLLDVRELGEVAIASLSHFIILPLSEYEQWSPKIMTELDPQKETIVMCHHGIRSAQMCQWLNHQGFENVKNVSGGIDAYAVYVDDTLARY